VDRAERAALADLAHLERQDEVAGVLAEAETLVERERLRVRVQEEMRGAACAQVLDHRVDEQAPGALPPARPGHVEVADVAVMLLQPGGHEPDRLAVVLGEEERVGVERALELRAVGLPACVRPGRRRRALRLPLLPERLQRREVVLARVPDGHAGGKRRRPLSR
jgi:hypothetical protein